MGDTLYVSDLDGTLLNNESEISTTSNKILKQLCHLGAKITIATARTPATVVDILKHTEISLPAIVMTGAAMFDISSETYSHMHFLMKDNVRKALEVFKRNSVHPFVYSWRPDNKLHAFHSSMLTHVEDSFYSLRRNMELKIFHIGSEPTEADMEHTLLMFAVGKRDVFMQMIPELERAVGYKVSYYNDIFSADTGFIEVFANDVSKAEAVRSIAASTNCNRIVAFGDNLNDIPMLKAATVAVAMGNAYAEVKNAADIIIGPNIDDSVARFIYKDFTGHDWK